MILERFEDPSWLANTWLVAAAAGGPALLVDAGGEPGPVQAAAERLGLSIELILLTHHHIDHAGRAGELAASTGARVAAHAAEAPLFGSRSPVTLSLSDRQRMECGGLGVTVHHIPGHTAGQLAVEIPEVGLFTGDTLFRRSVGGTVGPGHTTFEDLRRSLTDRILGFSDETPVLPGHRLPTTVGEERRDNPFLRVMLGQEPPGHETARMSGEPVRLLVWARDYDGGFKAWIRRADGSEDVVPGSRIRRDGAGD